MKRTILLVGLVIAGVGFLFTACEPFGNQGDIEYLAEEVFVYEEEAPLASELPSESRVAARKAGGRRRVDEFEYRIVRVAQIAPVVVGSYTTQANDVVIEGEMAVIGYNYAGDPFVGALQVVDISNPRYPVITAEIPLEGMNVFAVHVTGTDIYIAGSADPDTIPGYVPFNRAFVARIPLADLGTIDADAIENSRAILTSFAATGIAMKGDTLFVGTGAGGGELEILTTDLTQTLGPFSYGDLRDIEEYHGGVIALQGTNGSGEATGRVLIFKADGSLFDELPITDFGSPEAKATIEVYDNHYAFLGLSEGGFEAVYLKENAVVGETVTQLVSFENPTVEWSTETDTNSVSYSGDLVFTANGEAGFRVFRVIDDLDKDNPPANFAQSVGFVPFDETLQPSGNYWSANHVEYDDGLLVVASGLGGVNFYQLSQQ